MRALFTELSEQAILAGNRPELRLSFCSAWDRAASSVLFTETVDTTFSIHQLLLAREVRVASRADVDADFFLSRAGLECVAANARDVGVKEIIRVKVVFHICLRNLPTVIT